MALIPPDAGIRMRMQTEANLLQPVAPAHEIPADLPDLVPGRVFTARVQEALPENTYRALVAGKTITLSLPEGAKTGQDLKLVVVERSTKSIVAKQVAADGRDTQESASQPYPFAKLSPAAQLIGQLLPEEGKTPRPAQLNRGEPLIGAPPIKPTVVEELAPRLAKAVAQSGLFYEAHQAQWVAGKLPLAELLQEPQGRYSAPAAFQHAAAESALPEPRAISASSPDIELTATPNSQTPTERLSFLTPLPQQKIASGDHDPTTEAGPPTPKPPTEHEPMRDPAALRNAPGIDEPARAPDQPKLGADGTPPPRATLTQPTQSAQQVPEELRPLVQQQLEAVATQRVFWHGEVWPQQLIDWEIEWERQGQDRANTDENSDWRTALSLTTPGLGKVDATLLLGARGVRIGLTTPSADSAEELRRASPVLGAALEAAGVPLLAFNVKHDHEPTPEQARV